MEITKYKVVLKKVESNHNNLRTNEVEGTILELPQVGSPIVLTGKSLTPGLDARLVYTTNIKELSKPSENEYLLKTQNSTYLLTVISTIVETIVGE